MARICDNTGVRFSPSNTAPGLRLERMDFGPHV
jgi:hypothetical protein